MGPPRTASRPMPLLRVKILRINVDNLLGLPTHIARTASPRIHARSMALGYHQGPSSTSAQGFSPTVAAPAAFDSATAPPHAPGAAAPPEAVLAPAPPPRGGSSGRSGDWQRQRAERPCRGLAPAAMRRVTRHPQREHGQAYSATAVCRLCPSSSRPRNNPNPALPEWPRNGTH